VLTRECIPDEANTIRIALACACGRKIDGSRPCDCAYAHICAKTHDCYEGQAKNRGPDFIITTGGTGISPRDVTPETTAAFCDKELPGVAEALRAASLAETNSAMLSRAYAGIHGQTIIVNFPGSVRACRFYMQYLIPVMEHAVLMLHDGKHGA
jgi:molybdopterin biosynthesis enzyme MoaB